MVLGQGKYGTVIYGKVLKTKPGTGNAAGRLIIVSLAEINFKGEPMNRVVKVLCWNSEKSEWSQLADKAKKLLPGQIVTFRVQFDIGDPNKATAFELKKKGTYKLTQENDEEQFIVCGKVVKTISSDNFFGAYVPVNHYVEKEEVTEWYLVSFFGTVAEKQRSFLGKGDTLFVRGKRKEVTLGNRTFQQIIPFFIKTVISA